MEFWKNILRISIVPIVLMIVSLMIFRILVIKNLWMLLFYGIVYIVLFGIASWVFEMNKYEKNLIKELISKVIPKINKLNR